MAKLTPRMKWTDAVWESDLTSTQKLVALTYAKYAGASMDDVWVVMPRLMELTSLARATIQRALRVLEREGWLVVIQRSSQHRSTHYALRIPAGFTMPQRPHSEASNSTQGPHGEASEVDQGPHHEHQRPHSETP